MRETQSQFYYFLKGKFCYYYYFFKFCHFTLLTMGQEATNGPHKCLSWARFQLGPKRSKGQKPGAIFAERNQRIGNGGRDSSRINVGTREADDFTQRASCLKLHQSPNSRANRYAMGGLCDPAGSALPEDCTGDPRFRH